MRVCDQTVSDSHALSSTLITVWSWLCGQRQPRSKSLPGNEVGPALLQLIAPLPYSENGKRRETKMRWAKTYAARGAMIIIIQQLHLHPSYILSTSTWTVLHTFERLQFTRKVLTLFRLATSGGSNRHWRMYGHPTRFERGVPVSPLASSRACPVRPFTEPRPFATHRK